MQAWCSAWGHPPKLVSLLLGPGYLLEVWRIGQLPAIDAGLPSDERDETAIAPPVQCLGCNKGLVARGAPALGIPSSPAVFGILIA